MSQFQPLKGFRDFLPDEMTARNQVFDSIESVAQRYGFHPIDLPALERLDLYLVKSGEELVEQTYSFEDKGGRDVTMTPEQTPSRARIIAADKSLSKPIKWYSTSKRWRYEATQKGRLREFYQTDFDIFGADTVEADAEILALAADLMDELNVLDAVDILINDRCLLEAILASYNIEADAMPAVLDIIDDKEKMRAEEFRDELVDTGIDTDTAVTIDELTDIAEPITTGVDAIAELVPDDEDAQDALARMEQLRDILAAYGYAEKITVDLSIVRGLAYYTGLVFEVFDTNGELRAVCGGGRYDDLVELFDGEETPAVGFAIGDAVIEELMKREGVWPTESRRTEVYVLPVSGDAEVQAAAREIIAELRGAGHSVDTDLKGRNVGDQFSYADHIGAETVIVIGSRDLENDAVTVKDMASGDERQVPREDILNVV